MSATLTQVAKPVVQSYFELNDRASGIKYLKLVKSPTGPHYIIDVMFTTGFRLTVDLYPGDSATKIREELVYKTHLHRESSFDQIKEAIGLVADCGERAMTEKVTKEMIEKMEVELMRVLWEEAALARILRAAPILRCIEYEDALRLLQEIYQPGPQP